MLVFLRVHIIAESPAVCHPKQRGTKCSGRALYTRPRSDTVKKHTLSLSDYQGFSLYNPSPVHIFNEIFIRPSVARLELFFSIRQFRRLSHRREEVITAGGERVWPEHQAQLDGCERITLNNRSVTNAEQIDLS